MRKQGIISLCYLLLLVLLLLAVVTSTTTDTNNEQPQQYQSIDSVVGGDPTRGATNFIHSSTTDAAAAATGVDSDEAQAEALFQASALYSRLKSSNNNEATTTSAPVIKAWRHFFDLTRIPRPSRDTTRVNDYIKRFAQRYGFEVEEDSAENIVVRVPATVPELAHAPSVVLQAHSDMVPDADQSIAFDFHRDAISLLISDDKQWLMANGTTLGADNGVGLAIGLALATDLSIKRGPLEILITTDEEIGMVSALKMRPNMLRSRYMINLDTEERDAFYIGCAGGVSNTGTLTLKTEAVTLADVQSMATYDLIVTGGTGGHSGMEIHLQRANAIKIMARVLSRMQDQQIEYRIVSINAGFAHNVIARQTFVTLVMEQSSESKVKSLVEQLLGEVKAEFSHTDPDLTIQFAATSAASATQVPTTVVAFKPCCTRKLVRLLSALPHGVIRMSLEMPGIVETSTNLAVVKTNGNNVTIVTSQRSFVHSGKLDIVQTVQAVFALAGAQVTSEGDYPGWKPNPESNLLKISKHVFRSKYGKDAHVIAVHAGLETGVFYEQYPDMDIISLGPEIQGAHSPSERVKIDDVTYAYELTRDIVEHIAKHK